MALIKFLKTIKEILHVDLWGLVKNLRGLDVKIFSFLVHFLKLKTCLDDNFSALTDFLRGRIWVRGNDTLQSFVEALKFLSHIIDVLDVFI